MHVVYTWQYFSVVAVVSGPCVCVYDLTEAGGAPPVVSSAGLTAPPAGSAAQGMLITCNNNL